MTGSAVIEPPPRLSLYFAVVGIGLKTDSFIEIKENLSELEDLVAAWDGEVVGNVVQILPQYQANTLMGSGKVQEIKQMIEESAATVIVVDHHLTGAQGRTSHGPPVTDRKSVG